MLSQSDKDVFTVRADNTSFNETVLAAVDGGSNSRRIIEKTASLSQDRTSVFVVYVNDALRPYAEDELSDELPTLNRALKSIEARKRGQIESLMAESDILASSLIISRGRASREIKKVVRELNTTLLVMGSGMHTGMSWALGSTANNILHGIQSSALILRTST